MILPQSFYNRSTLQVAQDLLGCFLVRKFNLPLLAKERAGARYKIVETEAYNGPKDLASHASRGLTPRNKIMFGKPGIIYVYFTYGMHYMLNIVTEKENYPAAILIRALELATHNSQHITHNAPKANGPAKLTKHLKINKSSNGLPIYTKKHGLWIESRNTKIKPSQIKKTTRIGVDYAGKYKNKKWRFYIKDSKFISKKLKEEAALIHHDDEQLSPPL
ncbi:MAG: DNA-3-methyladenine glycosylase [Patescibacteria group bacterium]|nr:DNA-3-methyladenine glycosylase [Patescibacteria group bacterium]